jgi:hypothetical protein
MAHSATRMSDINDDRLEPTVDAESVPDVQVPVAAREQHMKGEGICYDGTRLADEQQGHWFPSP